MATVIRNPVLIHCLRQFGITPEEARALDRHNALMPQTAADTYAELLNVFEEDLLTQAPEPDGISLTDTP